MKKFIMAVTLAVMVAAMPMAAMADEGNTLSLGTDHTYATKYIWRGFNATDDPVYQGDAWASYAGFTLNVWWNVDLTDINMEEGGFTEVDYSIDYSWVYEDFSFSAGGILYDFPHLQNTETMEVYVGVGYDILTQPSLTVYYDIDDADGFYTLLGMGHSFDLYSDDLLSTSLDLSTSIGWASENWNDFYYGAKHGTFVDLIAGASLPIGVTDYFSVTPAATYSTLVDGVLRSKAANDHEWIFSVTVSAEM